MPPEPHTENAIFAKCQLCADNPSDNIKQHFLSAISHEFKTPLTNLLGFSEILQAKKHDKEEQALLNHIQHEAEKLLQLVNEALSAAARNTQLIETQLIEPEQHQDKMRSLKKPLNNAQQQTETTPRLLIVDDMEEMHLLLKFYLRGSDYLLEFAHNGQQAVEMHQQNPYQIIIMDMRMPIMNGLQATQKIRLWEKEQQRENSTIIGLTADHSHRQHYLSQGCSELLTKPVQRQKLLDIITSSLTHMSQKP